MPAFKLLHIKYTSMPPYKEPYHMALVNTDHIQHISEPTGTDQLYTVYGQGFSENPPEAEPWFYTDVAGVMLLTGIQHQTHIERAREFVRRVNAEYEVSHA